MPKIPSRPALDLSGKWAVVELPTLPEEYLARTPDPHVLIRHEEFGRFTATYQFGAQQGEIECRVRGLAQRRPALPHLCRNGR